MSEYQTWFGRSIARPRSNFVEEIAAGIGHLDHAIKTARRFRQAYPGVDLVTVEGRSCEAIRQVVDGSLDIAIVVCQPEIPAMPHTHALDGADGHRAVGDASAGRR